MIFGMKSFLLLKELDCELICNKKILKTKTSFYDKKAANFHTRKLPETGSNNICWSAILIYSILQKDENYYTQLSLKECK